MKNAGKWVIIDMNHESIVENYRIFRKNWIKMDNECNKKKLKMT